MVCSSTVFAAEWTYCYNNKNNRLVFLSANDLSKNKDSKIKCQGSTFYQSRNHFSMLTEIYDAKGRPQGNASAPRLLEIHNGRRFLITVWNDLSKFNRIRILEPNFRNRQVKRHCQYDTYSDLYSVRLSPDKKHLLVRVRQPLKTDTSKFKMVWKKCKI